jgi:hypothetical protein
MICVIDKDVLILLKDNMEDNQYCDFEFAGIIGIILQLMNQNLFTFAAYILHEHCKVLSDDEMHKKVQEILEKTNGGAIEKIIRDYDINDRELVEFLRGTYKLRNEICHTYPVAKEYWYFKDGQLNIFPKDIFQTKVWDALVQAITWNFFIKSLYDEQSKEK